MRIIPRIFLRYYELIEDEMISQDEKRLIKLAFTLLNKRIEKNISQDEMAERTGLSKSVISRMETFSSIPSSLTLTKYASELGMELVLVDRELYKMWNTKNKSIMEK